MSLSSQTFEIIKGNTEVLSIIALESLDPRVLKDLTDATVVFRATYGAWALRLSSEDAITIEAVEDGDDTVLARISIPLTPAQTRSVPDGKCAKYEVEVRQDGQETTVLMGYLLALGGVNDDEGEA
jgi:hypothetical protein